MTIHSATASTASLLSAAGGGVDLDFDLSFLGQMVAFSLLLIILKPLLFDPLLRLFEERERRTEGARMLARKMDDQAGELLLRYQAEIDAARKAAGKDRERLRAEATKLESQIVAEARAEAGKLVDDGKAKIAREAGTIRAELAGKSDEMARAIASRVLGREIT
jgi:F-type H+-transporting ATPase subunit b